MYGLVTHGDMLFGVPSHAAVEGPSVHYTLVFNVFVLMQLFNQVRASAKQGCCRTRMPRQAGLHCLLPAPLSRAQHQKAGGIGAG